MITNDEIKQMVLEIFSGQEETSKLLSILKDHSHITELRMHRIEALILHASNSYRKMEQKWETVGETDKYLTILTDKIINLCDQRLIPVYSGFKRIGYLDPNKLPKNIQVLYDNNLVDRINMKQGKKYIAFHGEIIEF